MRRLSVVLGCCVAIHGVQVAAAQQVQPPYEAEVIAEETYVRSGPGKKEYYPTSKLRRGQRVKVRRHDYGGWYAIEPPEGSFSWVQGGDVREEKKGVGTVIGDNVMVRIGSFEGDERNVDSGIRLTRGEQVGILEKKVYADGAVWYRIRPVAGEERWVAGKDVAPVGRRGDEKRAALTETHATPSDRGQEATDASTARDGSSLAPPQNARVADHAGPGSGSSKVGDGTVSWSPSAEPVTKTPSRDVSKARPSGGKTAGRPSQTARRQEHRHAPQPRGVAPSPPAHLDAAGLLVEQADRRLAQTRSGAVAQWDLESVRGLYEQALDEATSDGVRFQARAKLQRLEQLEAIQRNHERLRQTRAATASRDRALLAEQRRLETQVGPSPPRYDGTGILRPTAVQGLGAPRYALTDARGNVRYYVSPALAGMDLRPYLEQPVAVVGNVSYRFDLAAYHVTVRQVIALQSPPDGEQPTEAVADAGDSAPALISPRR